MLLNKDKSFELRNSEFYFHQKFWVKKNKRKISFDVTIWLISVLWCHNGELGFLTREFQIPPGLFSRFNLRMKRKHSKQYNFHPCKCEHLRRFYQRKLLNAAITILPLLVIIFFPFFHAHLDNAAKILVKYFSTCISSE